MKIYITALCSVLVCAALLCLLYILDPAPKEPEEVSETTTMQKDNATTKTQVSETEQAETESGQVTKKEEILDPEFIQEQERMRNLDLVPLTLHLVVGTIGNAKEGGYAQIYDSEDESSGKLSRLAFNNAVLSSDEKCLPGWRAVEESTAEPVTIGYVMENDSREEEITIADTGDPIRDRIVLGAYQYLGLKFVMNGDSLTEGTDCSHFIHNIYKLNGIDIPDKPKAIFEAGTPVKEKNARPGDIVYYDVNDGYGHVALYIGNGFAINATGHNGKNYPQGGVHLTKLAYKDREEYQIVSIID